MFYKSVINNSKGSIFPFAFILILLATAFTLLQILQGFKSLNKMKQRSTFYLCFKYLNLKTAKHIKYINTANDVILGAVIAEKIPHTAAAARILKIATMRSQQLFFVSYMKDMLSNKYCSVKMSSHYISQYPYKLRGGFLLRRNIISITQLRKNKWTTWIINKNFSLKSKWRVRNALLPKIKLKTKEIHFDYF